MRTSSIHVSVGLLVAALLAFAPPAEADAEPGLAAGPAPPGIEATQGSEVPAPEGLPAASTLPPSIDEDAAVRKEIVAEDGSVLGTFTARASRTQSDPRNAIIEAKLAAARAAIAAAEAAGTRVIGMPAHDAPAPADLDRVKRERAAAREPQVLDVRPGVPGSDGPQAPVAPEAGEEVQP